MTQVHVCSYERRRRLRDDRVAKGAQFIHAGVNIISEQTNSGFSSPRFSIGSDKPFEIGTLL
jgi:hypothetical protein